MRLCLLPVITSVSMQLASCNTHQFVLVLESYRPARRYFTCQHCILLSGAIEAFAFRCDSTTKENDVLHVTADYAWFICAWAFVLAYTLDLGFRGTSEKFPQAAVWLFRATWLTLSGLLAYRGLILNDIPRNGAGEILLSIAWGFAGLFSLLLEQCFHLLQFVFFVCLFLLFVMFLNLP